MVSRLVIIMGRDGGGGYRGPCDRADHCAVSEPVTADWYEEEPEE
jgi:hypothetical protein